MTQTTKWIYYTGLCQYRVTKRAGLLSGSEEGLWILELHKAFALHAGLNYMGERGYELVGIHKTWEEYGGEVPHSYRPSYLYIFKKPLAEQTADR
jgi:hypothetical protein